MEDDEDFRQLFAAADLHFSLEAFVSKGDRMEAPRIIECVKDELQLTQRGLAKVLGVSESTVSGQMLDHLFIGASMLSNMWDKHVLPHLGQHSTGP